MTAKTATAVALMIWSVRNSSGISTRPTTISVAVPQRRRRTSGSRATHGCERTDLVGETPGGRLVAVGPSVLAPLQQQGDEDGRADDRRDEQRAARVPCDAVLEHAERDRGGGDGRQVTEPTDHERGERVHERREAQRRSERNAEDAGAQEQREERQRRGDRPHERREPRDRDAEHQRPFAALGRPSDGGAEPGRAEEHRDARPWRAERRSARSGRWPTG